MVLRLSCFSLAALILISVPALAGANSSFSKPYSGPIEYTGRVSCNMQGSPDFCMPLDASWTVVNFSGATECSGPANPEDPCRANDDDYSYELALGFTFDLYGAPQTSVYINNNGNLSFGAGYCAFTASGFPVSGYPMVAPFWGDVDTRSLTDGAGVVYYKQGSNYLAVSWDHVGYFSYHTDLQNTFQVIISDGTYEPMGLGNNVCFCYGDMNWTTGDASGGSGGYGGVPATVGVNKGDGVDYFQIGRFDHPGSDYDGPAGAADGVDYLDGQVYCFRVSGEYNQPPVPIGFPLGDLVTMCMGQTLELSVGFIGPEGDQTVHTDVDDGDLANFSYTSTDGNPSTIEMTFIPEAGQEGSHVITFMATDDYEVPAKTIKYLTIKVRPGPSATNKTTWGTIKSFYWKRK